jgi:hypothetical protein
MLPASSFEAGGIVAVQLENKTTRIINTKWRNKKNQNMQIRMPSNNV